MKEKWHKAFLGIGSNLGNRKKNINSAIVSLRSSSGLKIIKISNLYETKPIGSIPQGMYLNGVLSIITKFSPRELLKEIKSIEKRMGRDLDAPKWSERIIDIDILLYGNLVYKKKGLIIPHKLMHARFFVLRPFIDIAPRAKHPVFKETIKNLFNNLAKSDEIDKKHSLNAKA